MALLFGRTSEEGFKYSKTSALFRWLFGYDLSDTLVLFDKRGSGKVTFLVSQSKEQLLRSSLLPAPEGLTLGGRSPIEVEIILRSKNNEKQDFDRLAARLKAGVVGGVWNVPGQAPKEPQQGPFAEGFLEVVRDDSEGVKLLDVSRGFAELLLVKDTKDVNLIKSSCSISDVVFKKFVVPKIEDDANEGKKITPVKLSELSFRTRICFFLLPFLIEMFRYIEGYFSTPDKISSKLVPQFVESSYNPIFSSQPHLSYDLTKAENSSKPLDYSVIVCGVGSKYKSLCSNVVRTILINPTDRLTAAYNALVAAFKATVNAIRPGASMAEVYRVARQTLSEYDANV